MQVLESVVGNDDDQFSTLMRKFTDHQSDGIKLCLHVYLDGHLLKNQLT